MKKFGKFVLFVLIDFLFMQGILLMNDKCFLQQSVVRLHGVANSKTDEDQSLKLLVRDSVLDYMDDACISDKTAAMEYLTSNLDNIQAVAQQVVYQAGYDYPVAVTLQKEEFPTREYETFSLPSGCYDALRINIGKAIGKNWWCVTFPKLCLPAVGETFIDVASDAGFSEGLTKTLECKDGYRLRFYLLEKLGDLEKLLTR